MSTRKGAKLNKTKRGGGRQYSREEGDSGFWGDVLEFFFSFFSSSNFSSFNETSHLVIYPPLVQSLRQEKKKSLKRKKFLQKKKHQLLM